MKAARTLDPRPVHIKPRFPQQHVRRSSMVDAHPSFDSQWSTIASK